MAPTSEQIYDFLVEHTSKHPGHVWYGDDLVNAARKRFASTTQAISKRMRGLSDSGKLVHVEVSYNGLVFWQGDDDKLPYAHFNPYFPYPNARLEHGEVVANRAAYRDNLWANGGRNFYTVDVAYQDLREKFLKIKEEQGVRRKEEKFQERLEIRSALAEAAPQGDGPELIKALKDLLSSSYVDTRMFTSLSKPDDPSQMILSVDVRQPDLAAFLNVLRSGLTLPQEQSDVSDNVVAMNRS